MYKEVTDPSVWTYQNDEDFIEGVLVNKQDKVGPNNSWIYTIETPEGVKSVWGATLLDSRMVGVKIGSKIKITYKGLGEAKGGHSAPKIYKVEVDEPEEVPVVTPGSQ